MSATPETKVCRICGTVKSRSEFYKHSSAKDGLSSRCKPCDVEQATRWKAANKARVAEATKARYYADLEASRAKARERYAANAEKNRQRY